MVAIAHVHRLLTRIPNFLSADAPHEPFRLCNVSPVSATGVGMNQGTYTALTYDDCSLLAEDDAVGVCAGK
jgi:hypothetical protein